MHREEKERFLLKDSQGEVIGEYSASYCADPLFVMSPEVPVQRGHLLTRIPEDDSGERRVVVGVSIFRTILGEILGVLAPRQVEKPDPYRPYHSMNDVELRPGAWILGGRDSGFYDGHGLIVEAKHIGGDPELWHDWAYYVIGPSDFHRFAPQWILLDAVSMWTKGPGPEVIELSLEPSTEIDRLLDEADSEIVSFFVKHPAALEAVNPSQFECVVDSVYRNLGFATERLGAWNQADGGVDIIAVSKTPGASEVRLAIQCKASRNRVSARPIRELAGVLGKFTAHKGIVATTSKFTSDACRETEGHFWMIGLQDRDALMRRMLSIVHPDFKDFIDRLEAQDTRE